MADDVQLTDLEVVQRWSLAVRQPAASREDLVAVLEADLAWLRSGGARRRATASKSTGATKAAPRARRAPRA